MLQVLLVYDKVRKNSHILCELKYSKVYIFFFNAVRKTIIMGGAKANKIDVILCFSKADN